MSTAFDLIKEIEKLPPAERVRMIDQVIRDTIKPDAEIEEILSRGHNTDFNVNSSKS